MIRRRLTALMLVAACGTLSGCLVSSSSSSYETGRKVTTATTSQIELGKTTREWLVATLGEPTSTTLVEAEDGARPDVEVMRYDWQERRESGGAVFLIFAGSSSKATRETTYFEITDGVVTRYWSE